MVLIVIFDIISREVMRLASEASCQTRARAASLTGLFFRQADAATPTLEVFSIPKLAII